MGSLEKIDENNFVIKMKTGFISYEFKDSKPFEHLSYIWKLRRDEYPSVAAIYLNCDGPVNKFWSIDASVTIIVKKLDGTVVVTKSFDNEFDQCILERGVPLGTQSGNNSLTNLGPDIEVHVKINSIAGIHNKTNVEFEIEDEKLSDVALVIEGKSLYANKAVLATFSPVFRVMFFSGFKESTDKEVVINDVEYEDFKQFLQVIHFPYPDIDQTNVKKLLVLADRYDVGVVVEKCEKYLKSTIDVVSPDTVRLAETYRMQAFHKKCMDSIDTKEKLKSLCKYGTQFGPITSQVIIKKFMQFS